MATNVPTAFAPSERADREQCQQDYQYISHNEMVFNVLNAVPNIILVLNEFRQIIYYNQPLISALNLSDSDLVIGMRPGELLNCIHSHQTEGGCGTTESCRYCGAVLAILAIQEGKQNATQECRVTVQNGEFTEAMDLSIATSRFVLENNAYTFFSIVDISSDKRRQALERIFFHDVLNTAGSLHSTIELLLSIDDTDVQTELLTMLPVVSRQLISEVKAQYEILRAEKDELMVHPEDVDSIQVINDVITEYKYVNYMGNHTITLNPAASTQTICADTSILRRIVGNMLKNALEASRPNDTITLDCYKPTADTIAFAVQNPQYIPRDVQLQIFSRSFSTKGNGRGLGTYSMKLLTEKYLNGKITFTSDEEKGTRFEVVIPITPPGTT